MFTDVDYLMWVVSETIPVKTGRMIWMLSESTEIITSVLFHFFNKFGIVRNHKVTVCSSMVTSVCVTKNLAQ